MLENKHELVQQDFMFIFNTWNTDPYNYREDTWNSYQKIL